MSHLLFDNNDIEVYFKLYLLLYGDDTVTVVFAETAAELQSALNAMYLYCETWKLKVNAAKTNVVIFSKKYKGYRFLPCLTPIFDTKYSE
jgi:hypothetical protein